MQFVLPTCRGVAFGRYALGFAENRRPNAAPLRQRPTNTKSVRISNIHLISMQLVSSELTSCISEPIIVSRHLNHIYGKGQLSKRVLHNIDLDIYPGEIVIMTGPSGSGKTTLLSLIGGLRSTQAGSLQVMGQELHGATESELRRTRRNTGYIFQAHNLLDSLTVQENVQMALELHDCHPWSAYRDQTNQILELVGLGNRMNDYPNNLSGGQKQRVAIARALVANPKIILADEPTASLDKQTGRDVVDLMQHLAKGRGSTILLVTHDNRILDIADRIVEMEDGCLK